MNLKTVLFTTAFTHLMEYKPLRSSITLRTRVAISP